MNKYGSKEEYAPLQTETSVAAQITKEQAYEELKRGVYEALLTYSNVHRGSGHKSAVTTHLYEQAREIVLDFFHLNKKRYTVIFCSPWRAETLRDQLKRGSYFSLSSLDFNLPFGVRALAVDRKALPEGIPFQAGGGTTKLVSPGWVIWADPPDRFEAGTPAIINVIAFAKALSLAQQYGNDIFKDLSHGDPAAEDLLLQDNLEGLSGKKLIDELRKTLIGKGVKVPTVNGSRPYINFDNGASTPTFEPVWDSVWKTWRKPLKSQQKLVENVKSVCSEFLGAPPSDYDVIFTMNTTEAINLAAMSLADECRSGSEPVVLTTILEHTSNDLPWRNIPGCTMVRLTVDEGGFVDLKELESVLSGYNREHKHGNKRIRLIAVTGASNVLGVFNNLAGISTIAHKYGARVLVDGAQMVAHRTVDMAKLDLDYFAFSAHKAYAPFGTGVLAVRKGIINLSSPEFMLIRSSGDENTGGIAALGTILGLLKRIGLDLVQEEEQALTRYALEGLSRIKGIRIYGIKDPGSPSFTNKGGVIAFVLGNRLSHNVARELAERGAIGVRSGCHCAHILVKHLVGVGPSLENFQKFMARVIPAMSFPGIVRISLGIENTREEIDTFLDVLGSMAAGKQPHASHKSAREEMNKFTRTVSDRVYKIN